MLFSPNSRQTSKALEMAWETCGKSAEVLLQMSEK
jgi:hypothetical protein